MVFFHGLMFRPLTTAAVVLCLAANGELFAAGATTAPNVTYAASGTFATPPISGSDIFQLQGQPFSISIVANAATVPASHGAHWAIYSNLKMTGTVQSALLPTPITIASNATHLELATGNPNYDVFSMECPIQIAGLTLIIVATIQMPTGTISNALIHPFTAPVTLTPANATMSYSETDGTNATTLGINGTLNATIPGITAPSAAAPQLYPGAQEITLHGGGARSVRSLRDAPVNMGGSNDAVALRFYAAGVSGASEVRVQIAGEDVPVLYAGRSGQFPGLDEITVQVPRSLAGRGPADVVVTVDGRQSGPTGIQVQ